MKLPLHNLGCHNNISGTGLYLWLLLFFVLLVPEPTQSRRHKPAAKSKSFTHSWWNQHQINPNLLWFYQRQSDPNFMWFFPMKSAFAKYGLHNNAVCSNVVNRGEGEILGQLQNRICADLLNGGTGCFCASEDSNKSPFTLRCGSCVGFPAIEGNCYPQINGMPPGSLGHPANWHHLSSAPIFNYVTGCYQYDTDSKGPHFTQGARNTPEECHEWCYNQSQDVPYYQEPCGEWTFYNSVCYLKKKGAHGSTRYVYGFVSGEAMCKGLKG